MAVQSVAAGRRFQNEPSIHDLKRYARDTEFHTRLRRIMAERGATRECLNFNFEDSPEGRFFETIAAAQGELEREQNGRQVTQKMRARVENGFWCFGKLIGYRYEKHASGGKVMVPEEPQASVIREAFEGLASGRFQNAAEVTRFFNGHVEFRTKQRGQANWQRTFNLLRNPLYAGLINSPRLGIYMKRGQHEPLVSVSTWQKAQEQLDGRALAPARKDIQDDFILRGFVCCNACGDPMTAAFSKGRNAHYGYYKCFKRSCRLYGKSIRKEKLEGEFETLIKSLKPGPGLVDLFKAMFAKAWEQQSEAAKTRAKDAQKALDAIEGKITKLVERIMQTEQSTIIAAFEREIEKLELQKAGLAETPPIGPSTREFRRRISNRPGVPLKPFKTLGFRASRPQTSGPTDGVFGANTVLPK